MIARKYLLKWSFSKSSIILDLYKIVLIQIHKISQKCLVHFNINLYLIFRSALQIKDLHLFKKILLVTINIMASKPPQR